MLNVKGGVWDLKNDASTAGGVFNGDASAATLNIDGLLFTAHNVRRVVTYAATTIANSTLATTSDNTVPGGSGTVIPKSSERRGEWGDVWSE